MQDTTKNILKKTDFAWNTHLPEALCTNGVSQIQASISGVNFSNNASISSHVRVNMQKAEHEATLETSYL